MFFMTNDNMLGSFTFSGVMDAVAEAMIKMELSGNTITAPLRTSVPRGNNTLMLMPCLAERDWGLKILSLFPDNPKKKKPFINGLFLLVNGEDGAPTALLDGRTLTFLRTGGVGGLAVRTLARPAVRRLGVAGTGVQGYWQARFACSVRGFSLVSLYDTMLSSAGECAERLKKDLPDLEIRVVRDSTELLENSDVVMTATNASAPIFPDSPTLLEGKLFVGIGSYRPDMREYPDGLFRAVRTVFVDTDHALSETGDLIDPLKTGLLTEERICALGAVLSGASSPPADGSGSFFKSVGFAAFDLFVARHLFNRGVCSGEGVELAL